MKAEEEKIVCDIVLREGFAACGITPAEKTLYAEAYQLWIDSKKHGEMSWLAENIDKRLDPSNLIEGASSVICVLDRYSNGEKDEKLDLAEGRVARYARGEDYHKGLKKRLYRAADRLKKVYPNEIFKVCVDTAPVLEREYASRAGLGSVGKNTLLIEPSIGSWSFLGEIVTTLKIESEITSFFNPCVNCTRCIDACPTGAIAPWSVDATKCISYLTIEHRGEIDIQFHESIGEWIYGCDLCQEVCPHNQPTRKSSKEFVANEYINSKRTTFNLIEVIKWEEEDRRKNFFKSAMKRAKLSQMRRNAVIVAGNKLKKNEDKDGLSIRGLTQAIYQATMDDDELVRKTAKAVYASIPSV